MKPLQALTGEAGRVLDDLLTQIRHADHSSTYWGLIIGPPGVGKTAIARRVAAGIMPRDGTTVDRLALYRMAGLEHPKHDGICPFRAPHHTASRAGMCGTAGRPGEVSLAHGGVLFLDELPEFATATAEAAMDTIVARRSVHRDWTYPAHPRVVLASANPCPCGWYGMQHRTCACSEKTRKTYLQRAMRWRWDSVFTLGDTRP